MKTVNTIKCEVAFENLPTIEKLFNEYEAGLSQIPWDTEEARLNAKILFTEGMLRYVLADVRTQMDIITEVNIAYKRSNNLIESREVRKGLLFAQLYGGDPEIRK